MKGRLAMSQIPDIEQAGDRCSTTDRHHQPQFRPEEVKLDWRGRPDSRDGQREASSLYAQRDGGWRFWIRIERPALGRCHSRDRKGVQQEIQAESTKKDRVTEIAAELRKAQASVVIEKPQLWLRLVPTESLESASTSMRQGAVSELADGCEFHGKPPIGGNLGPRSAPPICQLTSELTAETATPRPGWSISNA